MLPPFIIEQIRRREEQERAEREAQQPRLELPIEPYRPIAEESEWGSEGDMTEESPGRGVMIIQF